jgi:hypothetical protein
MSSLTNTVRLKQQVEALLRRVERLKKQPASQESLDQLKAIGRQIEEIEARMKS